MSSLILHYIIFVISTFTASYDAQRGGSALFVPTDTISFALPAVPDSLSSAEDRADFLASHYWDKFDFANCRECVGSDDFEQYWADYCYILNIAHTNNAKEAITGIFDSVKRKKKIVMSLFELSDKYLNGTDSPAYNEEIFVYITEKLISSRHLSRKEKNHIRAKRNMALKNAQGSYAENFFFVRKDGEYEALYEISSKYIILFFYYPDCSNCRTMIKIMERSKTFNKMISSGELKILCIYPEGDMELWKKSDGTIPRTWINACDRQAAIMENSLYRFKGFPSLYLLDTDKKVLLKDCDYFDIEDFLNGIK